MEVPLKISFLMKQKYTIAYLETEQLVPQRLISLFKQKT
jgi:hypothetical protein